MFKQYNVCCSLVGEQLNEALQALPVPSHHWRWWEQIVPSEPTTRPGCGRLFQQLLGHLPVYENHIRASYSPSQANIATRLVRNPNDTRFCFQQWDFIHHLRSFSGFARSWPPGLFTSRPAQNTLRVCLEKGTEQWSRQNSCLKKLQLIFWTHYWLFRHTVSQTEGMSSSSVQQLKAWETLTQTPISGKLLVSMPEPNEQVLWFVANCNMTRI